MPRFRLLSPFLFFFIPGLLSAGKSFAQRSIGNSYLEGVVLSAESGETISGASIANSTTHNTVISGADGSFRIYNRKDDRLVVTAANYEPYFFTASGYNGAQYTVRLQVKAGELSEVVVRPRYYQYQADSARRASTYQRTLARTRTSSAMSPVSLLAERFNKRSKQIRNFQQEFNQWEDQRYIDVRYNPDVVAQLTGLKNDSLAAFMNAYTMPFDYARAASDLEVKMWIRNNYREWMLTPFVPAVRPELVNDSIRVVVPNTAEGGNKDGRMKAMHSAVSCNYLSGMLRFLTGFFFLIFSATAFAQTVATDTSNIQLLDSVSVRALRKDADRDSVLRRQLYRKELDESRRKVQVAVGFPVLVVDGLFTKMAMLISGRQKKVKRFAAQLEIDEAARFVGRRYNEFSIRQHTAMSADSAAMFLRAHPMPLDFAREASELELQMWIREHYREWIRKD